jgi:hypothetical protein
VVKIEKLADEVGGRRVGAAYSGAGGSTMSAVGAIVVLPKFRRTFVARLHNVVLLRRILLIKVRPEDREIAPLRLLCAADDQSVTTGCGDEGDCQRISKSSSKPGSSSICHIRK